MNKHKELTFGTELRARLLTGVTAINAAVSSTLGPRGRIVILEQQYGMPPIATKDGVSVAKEICLPDSVANAAVQMMQGVASNQVVSVGDGTTTSIVLANAIIQEGFKAVAAGMAPSQLKIGIDAAVRVARESIIQSAIPCEAFGDIAKVGTISANGDKSIGKILAEGIEQVGKNGVITVEEGSGFDTTLTVVEGMQIDRGYLSPKFITDTESNKAVLMSPLVMIVGRNVNNINEILPALELAASQSRPLLIIADDINAEALSAVVFNHSRGNLKACIVKSPGFGTNRKQTLEDIAILTGATVLSDDNGIDTSSVNAGMLGTAGTITITANDTTILSGAGSKEAISSRVATIRKEHEESTDDFVRDMLLNRIAKLDGGIAVIRVGGSTEVEMKERKDRVDDALCATRAAIEEGVVAGGGTALARASKYIGKIIADLELENEDQVHGVKIALRAMTAPIRQIASNAGEEGSVILNEVTNGTGNYGYNANTDTYGDMMEMGILDPAKVTRSSLEYAASVAGLMMTADCMIGILQQDDGGFSMVDRS